MIKSVKFKRTFFDRWEKGLLVEFYNSNIVIAKNGETVDEILDLIETHELDMDVSDYFD